MVLAREAGAGKAKLVIDRGCSRLGVAEGEVVCVTNQDSRPVDMGRWLLRNRMGRTHYFRDGFVLAPGATVRVHTVAGTDTETDLYWGYQFTPAWEKRDKLTLVDRSNEQVDVLDTTA